MTLIASTTVRPADGATRPYRFVLRLEGSHPTKTPYVVHMETDPGTPDAGFHNGYYCANMLEGARRLQERAQGCGLHVLDAQGKLAEPIG